MEEDKALEQLKHDVGECYACPWGSSCKNRVFGEGPLGAEIMSISEAPGADEDKTGRPYAGKAGRFWEGMLQSVGWHRNNLYVCNVLKCRPYFNGKGNAYNPDLSDIDACLTFIQKQIVYNQPKLILTFGKVPLYALGFIEKQDFSKAYSKRLGMQSQPYTYYDLDGKMQMATVFSLFHPSYLMQHGRSYCGQMYIYLEEAKEHFHELAELAFDGR